MCKLLNNEEFPVGCVARGVIQPEELFPILCDVLEPLAKASGRQYQVRRCEMVRQHLCDADYFCSGISEKDLKDLLTFLNDYAPTGYYFGVHPCCGSEFGFWKSGGD